MNLISIIVPVYNSEQTLKRCVESILLQDSKNWELILIDDGSTDNSYKICKEFSEENLNIHIYSQVNSGPSTARNHGLLKAKGKYICFVDSDDYVAKDYISKLIIPFQKYKDVEMSVAGYYEISKFNKRGIKIHDLQKLMGNDKISRVEFQSNLFSGTSGVLWSKLFLKSVITEYNLKLKKEISLSEDLVFVLQYSNLINNIGIVSEHIYFYDRNNEKSLSTSIKPNFLQNIKKVNDEIMIHYNGFDVKSVTEQRLQAAVFAVIHSIANTKEKINLKKKNISELYNQYDVILSSYRSGGFNKKILFLLNKRRFTEVIILSRLRMLYQKIRYK